MLWSKVIFNGYIILVSSDFYKVNDNYLMTSINEATVLAQESGLLLPSPEVIEAIKDQATCKVITSPKDPADVYSFDAQNSEAKDNASACPPDSLKSGHFKAVTIRNGEVGIYGWYGPDGTRIQGFYSGHSPDYKDYSQAVRLVRPTAYKADEPNVKINAADILYPVYISTTSGKKRVNKDENLHEGFKRPNKSIFERILR